MTAVILFWLGIVFLSLFHFSWLGLRRANTIGKEALVSPFVFFAAAVAAKFIFG